MAELPDLNEKEKVVAEETIQAKSEEVVKLLFGPDTEWLRKFLIDVEQNQDVSDIPAFESTDKDQNRYFEYTKPLNGPIGPKKTQCQNTETIQLWDPSTCTQVITSTVTPDVPSGNAFVTYTSCVIARGENDNSTVIRMGTWLEWSGSSWLKGPIEKGAIAGQTSYAQDLIQELTSTLVTEESKQDIVSISSLNDKGESEIDSEKRPRRPHTVSKRKHKKRRSKNTVSAFWNVVLINALLTIALFLILRKFFISTQANVVRLSSAPAPDITLYGADSQSKPDFSQWLDSVDFNKLGDKELDEAIDFTEDRLIRLRAFRDHRSHR